jgi:hypothetical protein
MSAELLVSRTFRAPSTTIRPATIKDWPAILAMREAYYKDLGDIPDGRPLLRDLENCVWHVAERAGAVTCCISWRDFPNEDGSVSRFAFDFFRSRGRAALVDFIRTGRWATLRAEADGVELVLTVDVRNTPMRKALKMTGQWEAVSIVYRRRNAVSS